MTTLLTPEDLSQTPPTYEFELPAYDWNRQQRTDVMAAGKYTSRSVQTFDYRGKPTDSNSDYND
jgi:hypothetical protein